MPERKPIRMRAACGRCHAAKVKCSGERDGCKRCLKLGLRCEYGVSMVGRASKSQSAKESLNSVMRDIDGIDVNADDEGADGDRLVPGGDGFSLPLDNDYDFNFAPQDFLSITGLNDFNFGAFPGAQDSPELSVPDFTTTSLESSGPGTVSPPTQEYPRREEHEHSKDSQVHAADATAMEFSTGMPRGCPSRLPPDMVLPEIPLSLSEDDEAVSPSLSMEPLFALSRLVWVLERELWRPNADKAIDKTLMLVRTALQQLMKMVKWPGTMPSYGCRALTFAALTLIVKLYSQVTSEQRQTREEQTQSQQAQDSVSSSHAHSSFRASAAAQLRLGSFEPEPEDQLRLQNQMIAAELGRCVDAIRVAAEENAKRCERGGKCGGVKNYYTLADQAEKMQSNLVRESHHDKRMIFPLI